MNKTKPTKQNRRQPIHLKNKWNVRVYLLLWLSAANEITSWRSSKDASFETATTLLVSISLSLSVSMSMRPPLTAQLILSISRLSGDMSFLCLSISVFLASQLCCSDTVNVALVSRINEPDFVEFVFDLSSYHPYDYDRHSRQRRHGCRHVLQQHDGEE